MPVIHAMVTLAYFYDYIMCNALFYDCLIINIDLQHFLINAHPLLLATRTASKTIDLYNFEEPENCRSRYILTSPRSLEVRF